MLLTAGMKSVTQTKFDSAVLTIKRIDLIKSDPTIPLRTNLSPLLVSFNHFLITNVFGVLIKVTSENYHQISVFIPSISNGLITNGTTNGLRPILRVFRTKMLARVFMLITKRLPAMRASVRQEVQLLTIFKKA